VMSRQNGTQAQANAKVGTGIVRQSSDVCSFLSFSFGFRAYIMVRDSAIYVRKHVSVVASVAVETAYRDCGGVLSVQTFATPSSLHTTTRKQVCASQRNVR
jgi:hypothetical protein